MSPIRGRGGADELSALIGSRCCRRLGAAPSGGRGLSASKPMRGPQPRVAAQHQRQRRGPHVLVGQFSSQTRRGWVIVSLLSRRPIVQPPRDLTDWIREIHCLSAIDYANSCADQERHGEDHDPGAAELLQLGASAGRRSVWR